MCISLYPTHICSNDKALLSNLFHNFTYYQEKKIPKKRYRCTKYKSLKCKAKLTKENGDYLLQNVHSHDPEPDIEKKLKMKQSIRGYCQSLYNSDGKGIYEISRTILENLSQKFCMQHFKLTISKHFHTKLLDNLTIKWIYRNK